MDIDKYPIKNVGVQSEETWDDYDVQSYNPKTHCENSEVLRRLDVESRSKKKDFQMLERRRLSNIIKEQTALSTAEVQNVVPENKEISKDIKRKPKAVRLLEQLKLGAKTSYVPVDGNEKDH